MKKALISIIVVVLLLSSALVVMAACDPASKVDYEHTIVFYSSQGDSLVSVTQNAIDNFQAKYPGWTVLHQTQGGYDDVRSKVVSDFQGQNQPDLVYCYADHVAQYIQTSKVVDMNKFINSTETIEVNGKAEPVGYTKAEVEDFVQGYYNEGKAANFADYETYGYKAESMLALPFVKSTEVLYYNNTALKKAGISAPAKTWDELWQHCATLKTRFPTATPLGYDSEANWFITMCEQNGWGYTSASGNHYLFNGDKQKAWLEDLADYYELGYISTQEEYGAYTSALFTAGEDTGCIYCIGSSGGASHQNPGDAFEWGVAPIPGSKQTDDTVNYSAISQGPSLAMLSGGHKVSNVEEKELMTWLFVKELLDPTFQAAFAQAAGYNPARESANENATYAAFLNGNSIVAATAKVASTMTDRYFTSPAFVGSSTARTQVGNALVAALTGEKDPAKALADAYKNCGGK